MLELRRSVSQRVQAILEVSGSKNNTLNGIWDHRPQMNVGYLDPLALETLWGFQGQFSVDGSESPPEFFCLALADP